MKKYIKITGWIICSLVILYWGLFLYPKILFGKKIDYKFFSIYSHGEIDSKIYFILDSAEMLITTSEFYKNNIIHQNIFICDGYPEFTFWADKNRKAFAVNRKWTNDIFLARIDIPANKIRCNKEEYNIRKLSCVIAHETTHTLLRKFYTGNKLTVWQEEGYCDYIAKEGSFPTEEGLQILCNNLPEASLSYDCFKYRLYMRYLIEERKLSFNKVADMTFSIEYLDNKIKNIYCP